MNNAAMGMAISAKYPDLVQGEDWYFQDNGDGAYLAKWPAGLDQPSEEEVSAAALRLEQQTYTAALEGHYDSVAKQRRYDDRKTCTLRAGYAGPFQMEGTAFGIWMDTCNVYAYEQMDAVIASEREKPTPEELIAELPPMVWPQ